VISSILWDNLTYLSDGKLSSIVETCRQIEDKALPGIFVEAGCALGGSTILISYVKEQHRPLHVYDVFEMIPPPTSDDGNDVHERYNIIAQGKSRGIGGDTYYGYEKDLYETVRSNLRKFDIDESTHNVCLIKGLVQEKMHIDQPVAFAHIDVDWYGPVRTCLERIAPKLVVGGSIILDDYNDWSGCRKATDEFLQDNADQFTVDDSTGSRKLIRVKKETIAERKLISISE
jgi:asparagine synthase (glutamine-hydrolysing)